LPAIFSSSIFSQQDFLLPSKIAQSIFTVDNQNEYSDQQLLICPSDGFLYLRRKFQIMDLKLKDKVAFISGSTAGIGFAIAQRFIAEGAQVIINGRTQEGVNKAVAALKATYKDAQVSGIPADFSKSGEVDQLLKALPEVDILVNNAGIFEPKAFTEIPDEDWFRFFEVNVMSGIRLSRHYFPKMLAKNWGRIIFISSESGVFIPDEMIHYGMTKTAQIAVSRGLAELTKGTGVTVNSILPGPTRSKGVGGFIEDLSKANNISVEAVEEDFFKNLRPTSLLQRFASVEEIADTTVYFCSPLASATNGAAIRVEGGLIRSVV
jgi:NAD(P)-dependent dehydrogenase (short-subunit alcohol dehydrogenase family)